MHISYKPLVCILVLASYVHVLPFTVCSDLKEFGHHYGNLKSTNDNSYKVSSQKTSDITVHGLLLWASMGFLMPLGILTIRMSNREEQASRKSRVLFYLHVAFQMLAVLLGTVGAAMSLKKFENSFDNSHQRLGLALYAAILVQAFIGFFRPQRGKKERSYWYVVHWMLGTIVSVVGIINIYTGLKAYHKRTLKSTTLWTILFSAQVSFIAFLYLFQDKLDYIKKKQQGVIIITDIDHSSSLVSSNNINPQIPQTHQNHKDLLPLACGAKTNSLANLFD